jgi:hypothetical protein
MSKNDNTVVEHTADNPKIKGLNLAPEEREMAKKFDDFLILFLVTFHR